VFDPGGAFMYVAAFGTDRVARVDTNGRVLSFVEVAPPSGAGANVDPRNKRGPRGLALKPLAGGLYVLNRISNTISVIDTRTNTVAREVSVGADPTPPAIREGRGFLYDAKLSGNGTGSCASCHVDGDMDHLAWDLGDPGGEMVTVVQGENAWQLHPMKGPMVTQTLRGLPGTGPLHWRGDKANFLEFNGAFDALMGGSEIPLADMQAFATFVEALVYAPNPHQKLDRSLPAELFGGNAARGREVFITVPESPDGDTCNTCHKADPGPGTDGLLVQLPQPEPMKTAHLRNIYQKTLYTKFTGRAIDGFGMDHEGHVASLPIFLSIPGFAGYTAQEKADMTAFMMAFDTGTAPAVGYTITLNALNVDRPLPRADWSMLEQQARLRNVDVVVNGTVNGQVRTLSFRPALNDYIVNGVVAAPLTRAGLEFLLRRGDVLSVMGVSPREGIARVPLVRAADVEAASRRGPSRRGH
jgi:YVTN family beta-propeller protein